MMLPHRCAQHIRSSPSPTRARADRGGSACSCLRRFRLHVCRLGGQSCRLQSVDWSPSASWTRSVSSWVATAGSGSLTRVRAPASNACLPMTTAGIRVIRRSSDVPAQLGCSSFQPKRCGVASWTALRLTAGAVSCGPDGAQLVADGQTPILALDGRGPARTRLLFRRENLRLRDVRFPQPRAPVALTLRACSDGRDRPSLSSTCASWASERPGEYANADCMRM
jgi:hypothetical protein